MGKASKSSTSHRVLKDKAMNRVDDLQGMLNNLQSARKESRTIDVDVLEGKVYQMLCEWKSELNEPSPASSLQEGGSWSFSSEIRRLLHPREEEDDATSSLAALKPDPDAQNVIHGSTSQENFVMPKGPQEQSFLLSDDYKPAAMEAANSVGMDSRSIPAQINDHSYDFHQEFYQQYLIGFDGVGIVGEDVIPQIPSYQQNICPPPPCAFLGPKCALWDCPRPAMSSDWCQKSDDYCSSYHASLAPSESYPGCSPIVRPKGIGLKDNLLISALAAKSAGKEVGIPECEGAATAKSPWNAPELFDLSLLDGETIREWVFFDKPRKAFERGNRKQRSLPDYNGRGWHESRKQAMDEFGGLKRSYYMDPQPAGSFEWHLYEYKINAYDACALYRLEVKKSGKGKLGNDSVADLQKQMNKLTAEFPSDRNTYSGSKELFP